MRALITGGAGFIGSHLAERLLADGDCVAVLDDFSTGTPGNVEQLRLHPDFVLVEGSVLDTALVESLIASADVVYHLAAAVGVRRILDKPRGSIETNLQGSAVVFAASARHQRRVVFASTSEVYGKNAGGPLREDADAVLGATSTTRWLYAYTKAADECLALAYARERAGEAVVVRLFNTVGPRQSGQYGMVVPRFVAQALAGEPITVYGDGSQTRCFTDVADAVAAIRALAQHPAASGEVFNIGGSREISIESLARLVRDLAASGSAIVKVPYSEAYGPGFEDMQRRVPDVSKLRRFTGTAPCTPIEETVSRIIAHRRATAP